MLQQPAFEPSLAIMNEMDVVFTHLRRGCGGDGYKAAYRLAADGAVRLSHN